LRWDGGTNNDKAVPASEIIFDYGFGEYLRRLGGLIAVNPTADVDGSNAMGITDWWGRHEQPEENNRTLAAAPLQINFGRAAAPRRVGSS
jgi:hypothetical protein